MNKLFKRKIWQLAVEIIIPVLVVILILTQVAFSYSTLLNAKLGLQDYKVVKGTSGEVIDVKDYKSDYKNYEELRKKADELCYDVEAEGLVLLRNENNALPLAETENKVSLFLTGSVEFNCSRQGLRIWTKTDPISDSKYPTLKEALEDQDISVNNSLWDFYSKGAAKSYGGYNELNNTSNKMSYIINEAPYSLLESSGVTNTFSDFGDAAIVVVTRDDTEGSDPNVNFGSDGKDGNYLALSPEEREVLVNITKLKTSGVFKKIIVILNSALSVQLDFMYSDDISVDACLWVGNVGSSGIHAVAAALTGKVNPSGKLSDTYLKNNLSSPAMASWAMNNYGTFSKKYENAGAYSLTSTQCNYGVYVEGIYVGYRYYETRYADVVEGAENVGDYKYADDVAFPFGYGLSYTQFKYDDFNVTESADGKSFDVSVHVENVGDMPGKESVGIYVQKPYIKGGIEKAAVELVGFTKTKTLTKGDGGQTVTVNVEKEQLTSFDTAGAGTYVLDKGEYYFATGNGAHDALNNILAHKNLSDTQKSKMDAEGNASLAAVGLNVGTADTQTYSVSAETGNEIVSRLDFLDINRYDGKGNNSVTYVSRADWVGTFPKNEVKITVTDKMAKDLANKTLNDVTDDGSEMPVYGKKIGLSLAMLHPTNNDGEVIPFEDSRWDDLVEQMTFEEQNTLLTTGFCQTGSVSSVAKPQTKEMDGPTYCKESTSGARFPCEGIWASTMNLELLDKIGEMLANDCLLTGYSGMWIPGINIHRTPYGGRSHEYFSEDPILTGICAEAEIKGIQRKGVMAFPKHYAFNDCESDRNGVCVWLNEQEAREIMLLPWKYATSVKRGNAHGIMSSFNRAGALWTSGSVALIDETLRGEFGFEGFIITDMADSNGVEYMTTLNGILAGTDIWLTSSGHSFDNYKNNAVVCQKMKTACKRIMFNVCNYSTTMNGYASDDVIVNILTWWQITLIVVDVLIGVAAAGTSAMLAICVLKKRNEKD